MLGSRRRQLARKGATAQALGWYQPDRAVRVMPNKAAWYDVSDLSSMLNNAGAVPSSGDGIKLLSDKSGNSGVNAFIAGVGTGNIAYLTTGTAVGTGDFTVVQKFTVPPTAPTAGNPAVSFASAITGSSAANGLIFDLNPSYNVVVGLYAAVSNFRYNTYGALLASYVGQTVTLTLTRSGGTWTLYLNGVAQTPTATNTTGGGAPPAFTDTVNSTYTIFGTASTTNANTVANFPIYEGRAYSVALDATGVLADYNGTVQANNIVNVNFGLMAKLATAPVATSGQTITVTSTGATGARICGARDLYQGTAANQPIYLPHSGTNYGYFNGVAGNYASAPDSNALDITGDLDIRVDCMATDWTPAADCWLVSKYGYAENQRSYGLYLITTTGFLVLRLATVGTALALEISSDAAVSTRFSDLGRGWVRCTYDQDSGAGQYEIKFYTSTDGVTWSQLGSTMTGAAIAATYAGTAALLVGSVGSSGTNTSPWSGLIYRAQIYNGIAGTLAFDFNPAAYTSGTTFLDSSSNAATITINGGATVVTRSTLYFDGTNDYLKAAAFSLSQPSTRYIVGSQISWTLNDIIMDGNVVADQYIYQSGVTPEFRQLAASGASAANAGWAIGTNAVVSVVTNGASSSTRVNRVAAVAGTTGAGNANGVTLGAGATGGAPANITASEVLVRSVADGTSDQNRFAIYAGRKWRIAV